MKKLTLILFLLISLTAYSNSPQQIEEELLTHLRKIRILEHKETKASIPDGSLDSKIRESRIFKEKLLKYTQEVPATFTHPFDSLSKYIMICNSDDNKIRVYSWHVGDSESMCYYNNVFQYESDSVIYSSTLSDEDETNPSGYFTEIHSFKTEKDSVYIGYFRAFYSPDDFADSFETFRIEGKQLQDSVPLFKSKDIDGKDTVVSSIYVLYKPETLKARKEDRLLQLDKKHKEIKLTETDEFGNLKRKKTTYKFNGSEFEISEK